MRNLLTILVLCGAAQWASATADCPAPVSTRPEARPAAELISSAAAQAPLGPIAAQASLRGPAAGRSTSTQVMGGPPRGAGTPDESPRRGSRLAMVLAAVGVMLVIVLRRIGAS